MSRSCDWCNTRVVGTEPEWVCGKCFAGLTAERDAALAAQSAAEHALRDLAAREAKVGEYEDAILRLEKEKADAEREREEARADLERVKGYWLFWRTHALALAASGERMRAALEKIADRTKGIRGVPSSCVVRDVHGMALAALSPSPSPGLGAAIAGLIEAAREANRKWAGPELRDALTAYEAAVAGNAQGKESSK